MQELLNTVLGLLEANGGQMEYKNLYAALPYPAKQQLRNALNLGKAQGVIQRDNVVDEKANTVTYWVKKVTE